MTDEIFNISHLLAPLYHKWWWGQFRLPPTSDNVTVSGTEPLRRSEIFCIYRTHTLNDVIVRSIAQELLHFILQYLNQY